jgi:Leucine-rich repeat (LRR) protein
LKLYKSLKTAIEEREEVEALKVTLTGGKLPPEIFALGNLRELYLEGDIEDLPKIGTPWNKLRTLSIHWPSFKGDLAALFTFPSLTNLKIIETPIKRLTLPLGKINAPIKSLTIKSCGLAELPEEFSMLTSLEEINLAGNKLKALPQSFPVLARLKRLNLDSNSFVKFPDVVKSMPTLSHLSIDGNSFDEDEKARIHREFNLWLN